MRQAFSIVIILAMMFPHLSSIGKLIDFKINQDFIAEVFCTNKKAPQLRCNGKCYLAKQLKKAAEQGEKQTPTSKQERLEVVYFLSKSAFYFLSFSTDYLGKPTPVYENWFHDSSFIADVFHPPKRHLT